MPTSARPRRTPFPLAGPWGQPVVQARFTGAPLWRAGAGLGMHGVPNHPTLAPLWDAVDNPRGRNMLLTCPDACSSTIHSPYYFPYQNQVFGFLREEEVAQP